MQKTAFLVFVSVCVVGVLADGYGGGGKSYMVPSGGGKKKWKIKAKGKGLQNMVSYGGGKKYDDKKEVVYYPVPVYTPSKDGGGYGGGGGGYESNKHEVTHKGELIHKSDRGRSGEKYLDKNGDKDDEVVYYPVPIYTPTKDSYIGENPYESSKHDMTITRKFASGLRDKSEEDDDDGKKKKKPKKVIYYPVPVYKSSEDKDQSEGSSKHEISVPKFDGLKGDDGREVGEENGKNKGSEKNRDRENSENVRGVVTREGNEANGNGGRKGENDVSGVEWLKENENEKNHAQNWRGGNQEWNNGQTENRGSGGGDSRWNGENRGVNGHEWKNGNNGGGSPSWNGNGGQGWNGRNNEGGFQNWNNGNGGRGGRGWNDGNRWNGRNGGNGGNGRNGGNGGYGGNNGNGEQNWNNGNGWNGRNGANGGQRWNGGNRWDFGNGGNFRKEGVNSGWNDNRWLGNNGMTGAQRKINENGRNN